MKCISPLTLLVRLWQVSGTDQLAKIISECKPTSSSVDPIPTKIVLDCLDALLTVLVNIINSSLHSAIVLKPLKTT